MTSRELQPIILAAIVDAGYDGAKLTDTPHGLNMDSLDEVEIIMAIEDAAKIEIQDEWLKEEHRKKTFAALSELLALKLEQQNDITP